MRNRLLLGLLTLSILTITPCIAQTDAKVKSLVDQAIATHGGAALVNLKTFQEVVELQASGPFGMRMPKQDVEVILDRTGSRGRWQTVEGDKSLAIFQQTPTGVSLWTKKLGTQKIRSGGTNVNFLPPMKTGLVGLIALQNATDSLIFVEKGEIKGKRGRMIIRKQTIPQESLVMAGKGDLSKETCLTTWSYLFAPDGTLIAERITQTPPNRTVEMELSFDRFEVFDGIKVPTEISVKSNQIPSMVTMKQRVKRVIVNAPLSDNRFQMP